MTEARAQRAAKTKSGGTPGMGRPEIVACAPSGEADRSRNQANRRRAPDPSASGPPHSPSFDGVRDQLMDETVDNRLDNLAGAHRLTTARPRA